MDRSRLVSAQAQDQRGGAREPARPARSACAVTLGFFREVLRLLRLLRRLLVLVRQLAVRARLRPPDPRARARPRRRGAAAGAAGDAADLHPVLRRLRHDAPGRTRAVAERARLARRARSSAGSARRRSGRSARRTTRRGSSCSRTSASCSTPFNLLPIGFLDGGTIVRVDLARPGGGRASATRTASRSRRSRRTAERANLDRDALRAPRGGRSSAGMLATRHSGML